jgi:hypothetical protein
MIAESSPFSLSTQFSEARARNALVSDYKQGRVLAAPGPGRHQPEDVQSEQAAVDAAGDTRWRHYPGAAADPAVVLPGAHRKSLQVLPLEDRLRRLERDFILVRFEEPWNEEIGLGSVCRPCEHSHAGDDRGISGHASVVSHK